MHTPNLGSYLRPPRTAAPPQALLSPEELQHPRTLHVIGFRLSRLVLLAIIVFILGFLAIIAFHESGASEHMRNLSSPVLTDTAFQRRLQLLQTLQEEKKSYRDFTLQLAQMILLNLLLPVLTAILGYIFAAKRDA